MRSVSGVVLICQGLEPIGGYISESVTHDIAMSDQGYLLSRTASPPLGQYQTIAYCFTTEAHCVHVNDLPSVDT